MNIRYGNGASVVVRARESLVHGEGKQLILLIQLKENVRDIMRNPEKVLNSLTVHSSKSDYKYERLYRILFNEEMFYVAYQNIYAKQGNLTPGTDGKTADQMSIGRIERLIASLKNETYFPHPAKRVYIPKKNGKKRPLGIPSFEDKLVQEVIKMVLEAIYEKRFENTSHGFRPKRSCHTALMSIRNTFTGTKWFIEGDIKGFFDNINHTVLVNTLQERISDDRFIRLIRKFLNAGYVEDWKFHKTYSGTPQGGIISPLLANIYLDKFDKYISEYIKSFDRGRCREQSTEYRGLCWKRYCITQNLKTETNNENIKQMIDEIRNIDREKRSIPASNAMDKKFRRLKYVRYADDFLIGVIGSKAESEQIKNEIAKYMREKLDLELSEEKTLITQAQKPAKFLGYDIFIRKSNDVKRDANGKLVRMFNSNIVLHINSETMRRKLKDYDVVKFNYSTGTEVWKPKARRNMRNMEAIGILMQYNAEIRGFYNYYSIAHNSASINSFYFIMKYSFCKTLAHKFGSTLRKVFKKYYHDKKIVIPYTDKKGKTKSVALYNDGFKRKESRRNAQCDNTPNSIFTKNPSLITRLKRNRCELCEAEGQTTMFQVRNLKTLKGDNEWERKMKQMNRKTLAVCNECDVKIHSKKQS